MQFQPTVPSFPFYPLHFLPHPAKAGSAGIVNRVKARVYLLESDEGGLDEPLCQDHQLKLFSRTANVMTNVNRVLWERERRDDGASGVNDSAFKVGTVHETCALYS